MTRTPRRCLLAAGLASFLVPVVAMPAVSAESPYVDHVVQGGAVLFPHPVAPRSRLLVDPPVPRQASAKPRRSEAPSPPSVTAAPEPDQRPAPSAAPQSESAEARSAAPQPGTGQAGEASLTRGVRTSRNQACTAG